MTAGLDALEHVVRAPEGDAAGAIVLLHGRGTDQYDLEPLLGVLDPGRRYLGVTPRAPLTLPPGGAHWYISRRVGLPDPETFRSTMTLAGEWLDSLLGEHGLGYDDLVLGGFSQGAVMSYGLGLGTDRPRPAGVIALSGFIPSADGFSLALDDVAGYPVAIGHGTFDPVIGVEWGRQANETLEGAGADVTYREYPLPHGVDPRYLAELAAWVEARLA